MIDFGGGVKVEKSKKPNKEFASGGQRWRRRRRSDGWCLAVWATAAAAAYFNVIMD